MTVPLDAPNRDLELDREVLEIITAVQDACEHADCLAPNWTIPGHIPTQRLSGLKRRGHLDSEHGTWWVTVKGLNYLATLRKQHHA